MNRRRLPTTAQVGLLLPWIVAVVAARLPLRDNSFLWHVAAGQEQIRRGSVLTADPFSFTFAGEPWRTQSWLADLGYGVLDQELGWVPLFMVAVTVLVLGLTGVIVYRASGSLIATAIGQVATAWVLAAYLNPRPVILSFVLLALAVVAEGDEKARWILPLLVWVWAGLHGSFVIGIGYLVLLALRRRNRARLRDAALCVLAATFTAHGWAVWEVLVDFAANQEALDFIVEWATPDFSSAALIPFLGGVLLLIGGGIRGKLAVRDLWVIGPALYLATTATRAVPLAWLMLLPFLGAAMSDFARIAQRRSLINLAIAVIAVGLPFVLPIQGGVDLERFPVAVAAHMSSARTFHDDVVGGWLIYDRWPEVAVFADDRAELYGAGFFREMVEVRQSRRDYRSTFDRYGITQALLRGEDAVVVDLIDAGWRQVAGDATFVLLTAPTH